MKEKSAWKRGEQRAQESISCLELAGHDLRCGPLLDLGCGAGYLTGYFLKFGIEVVGVGRAKVHVKFAKNNVKAGDFVLADGAMTPFKTRSFNTVILNDVLEHVPDQLAKPLLHEIKRILRIDGKLYISVANKLQVFEPHTQIPFLTWFPKPCWNALHKLYRKEPLYYQDTLNPYTIQKLTKLCQQTSFTYKDYTWLYTYNKLSNTQNIKNPLLRKIAKTIKTLKLSKITYYIAQRLSVIIFVCEP